MKESLVVVQRKRVSWVVNQNMDANKLWNLIFEYVWVLCNDMHLQPATEAPGTGAMVTILDTSHSVNIAEGAS